MSEVLAAIHSYFHGGDLPKVEGAKKWKPDPPQEWWSETPQPRKPIAEDLKEPPESPGEWD